MYTVPWTEEHETTVAKHWERGLSASKIASELSRILGTAITRNMVIGKVDRLRKNGLLRPREITIPTIKLPRAISEPRPPRARKQYVPKPDPLHIPMEALTKYSCTWSFGNPRDEDFNYCGLPVERRSFCAQHAALAYRQIAPQSSPRQKKFYPRVLLFNC
jgi:GcrA cell cycle regulator